MAIYAPKGCSQMRRFVTAIVCLSVMAYGPSQVPASGQGAERSSAQGKPASEHKFVLAHYMSWYVTQPDWGLHWSGPHRQHDPQKLDPVGLPDIWSHFHPLIGLYDSADPDVIECHLLQMRLAGIDGIILDWYGISDAADYSRIHEASKEIFKATERLGMNFAVCFEDRTIRYLIESDALRRDAIPDHLTETLQWLHENWFVAPNYVRIDERPLLLNFGPLYVKDATTWKEALDSLSVRPKFFALDHLWKDVAADGGFAWVYPQAWQDGPTQETANEALASHYVAISNDPRRVIVSALPGFDDVYKRGHPSVEYRDGATLEESLDVAFHGPWPIVQLVTWNDYGEGTMIEPTHEFGYLFLEIVQQSRREELGPEFASSVQDLRLPACLYELRQSAAVDRVELDRISELLSHGKAAQARVAMDRITDATVKETEPQMSIGVSPNRSQVLLTCSLRNRGQN